MRVLRHCNIVTGCLEKLWKVSLPVAGELELDDLQGTFQSNPGLYNSTEVETSREGQEFLNSTLIKLVYHKILLIYFLPS